MRDRLKSGLLPVLLLSGALLALGCGGGDDDPEAVCGNGVIEAGEQCDGVNLNEQTCVTKGFDGGTLSCTADCKFDTSGCTDAPADCGNGVIEAGEQCDGANLNGQNCKRQGFDEGTLSCTADCQFDTSACITIPKVGVGEPCTRDIECESDLCLTEVLQGFPSGYCAAPCNGDGSCDDENAICVDVGEYLCLRSCAPSGSDCRNAYKCVGLGDGAGACWPACTEDSQCTTTGDCNNQGFCETQCTDDADCQAGMACGLEGVCEPIEHCVTQGCNDPEGSLYCHEASGYCYDDACIDNPCDSLANASGVCERQYDDYRCGCVDEHVWDRAADACIASECNAIDLGTFDGTRIEQTGDTCNGTSIYDAGGSGVTNCTGYPSWDKELVYKLTVPAGEAVEVRMETAGFDASLWVTTSCDDFLGLECVVGADDPETVLIYNDTTEDQTYYIIADAYRNCGEFTLSVSEPPHCGNGIVDGNDQCDGDDFDEQTCAGLGYVGGGTLGCTQDCKFDTSGCIFGCQAVKLGTFSSSITRDNQDTCASTSLYDARGTGDSCTNYSTVGNEIVYELTVPAGQRVLVAVDPTGFDAAIWVTPSCDDRLGAQCIVGVDRASAGGREELSLINDGANPQTYYIVVDAFRGCGTFNLSISTPGECGNGVKEDREQCDGSDFGEASCSNFGFVDGTLGCSDECKLDFTNCNYGSLLLVGDPCTTDADCASGICWDELNKGLPGGYCVDKCTEEYGCWDPANICVSYLGDSFCAKTCTPGVPGECRDAYACVDLDGGIGACWPKCTTDSQCSVAGRCDLDSGLCTCLLGQHLDSEAGACVYDDCEYLGCANLNLNCDPAGGCSGACAICTDCVSGTELSSSGRCVRIDAAWGGPCEVDADCPGSGTPGTDTYCNKSGTGGFCMQLGAPDYVGDGQPCTGDPNSVGVKVVYGPYLVSVCLQGCETNADCRAGYACSTDMDYNHSVLACSPITECGTDGCNDDGSLRCASDGKCWLDSCDPNPCTDVPHSTKACVNARDSHVCECVDDYRWDDDSMSCVSFECTAQDLGTVTAEIQLMGENGCTGTNEYDAAGTGVSCTKYSTMGNEKVYRITLPARVSALIRMEPSGFDASLWVTTRCNDISGVKCVKGADDDVGTPEVVTITNMSSRPATYYIVADAYSGCGTFNLTITPK